jgi:protease-4
MGLFILMIVLFVIFLGFSFFLVKEIEMQNFTTKGGRSSGMAEIAVIKVEGIIMESKQIIEDLMQAEEDESIKAIILRVNSPGGAVGPTQEVYEEVLRIDKIKPVYASLGAVAASGGYYIAAATRKIFANAGTLTGSIGVIMQFMDMSKLYKWAKMNPETIKAGKYKDIGSPFRNMNTEEKNMMTDLIEGVHQQFINDIIQIRKEKIQGDIVEHAQGQIFSGEEALKKGLIDQIGGLWAAGRLIHEELELKSKFGLKFIEKKKKFSVTDFLENMEETFQGLNLKKSLQTAPFFIFNP